MPFRMYSDCATGDVDDNGVVDARDVEQLLGSWGPCPGDPAPCPADFDTDGAIGMSDLLLLLSRWD